MHSKSLPIRGIKSKLFIVNLIKYNALIDTIES